MRYLRGGACRHPAHLLSPMRRFSAAEPCIPHMVGNVSGALFRHMCEDAPPFVSEILKMKLVSVRRGHLVMDMKLTPKFWLTGILEPGQATATQTHSGLLAAIADHTGGLCGWTVLGVPGQMLSTVDLRVDYCAPLIAADKGIISIANVASVSEKLIWVDIECWNMSRTKQVACGRAIYNIYSSKPGIQKLKSMAIKLLCNNQFVTGLLLRSFRMQLMTTHLLSHKLKAILSPSTVCRSELDMSAYTEIQKNAIHFAERMDTHLRRILGTRVTEISDTSMSLSQQYKHSFTGNFVIPCLHGGVTAALMEHCAQSFARVVSGGRAVLTDNISIDYLAPAPCFTDLIATSSIVGFGHNRLFIEINCYNQQKSATIALGRASLSFL